MVRASGRLSERIYRVLIPETKKAVTTLGEWAALGTLAGTVRPQNQDRLVGGQFTSIDGRLFRMIALSDGMGGLRYGQEAASLTLASFLWFLTSFNGPMLSRLYNAANFANEQVAERFRGQSGATLSAVVVTADGDVFTLNVGDSRIYGYDDDAGLVQLSTDDTLAGLAQQGIFVDEKHNSNALLQHIGMGDGLEPHADKVEVEDLYKYYLLTTDGIHWVGNKLLSLIAENALDHTQLTRRLLALAEMTGAHDNASLAAMSSTSPPPEIGDPGDDMIDMELWTPEVRTVLISDRRASLHLPSSPSKSDLKESGEAAEKTSGSDAVIQGDLSTAKPDEYRFVDPAKPLPPPRQGTKSSKRAPRKRSKKDGQGGAPLERPELFVEFESRRPDSD